METVYGNKTSVNFYQTTQHNILENSHLWTCHHENMKSHQDILLHNLMFLKKVLVTQIESTDFWYHVTIFLYIEWHSIPNTSCTKDISRPWVDKFQNLTVMMVKCSQSPSTEWCVWCLPGWVMTCGDSKWLHSWLGIPHLVTSMQNPCRLPYKVPNIIICFEPKPE